jgi:hypothetical protein
MADEHWVNGPSILGDAAGGTATDTASPRHLTVPEIGLIYALAAVTVELAGRDTTRVVNTLKARARFFREKSDLPPDAAANAPVLEALAAALGVIADIDDLEDADGRAFIN